MQSLRVYAWIEPKRKEHNSKNRGTGSGRFLVKEYLCDIIEVTKYTKFDENIWIKIPGERGAKCYFLVNLYMPPESKNTITYLQRKFGEVAVDVQRYNRQGEVALLRY